MSEKTVVQVLKPKSGFVKLHWVDKPLYFDINSIALVCADSYSTIIYLAGGQEGYNVSEPVDEVMTAISLAEATPCQ